MIIDADTHISGVKFDGLAIDADELLRRMDGAGVDRALVWLKPPYDRNVARENAAVYEATRRFPDRLLGFGWTNPRLGCAAARAEIRRCIDEYGFYGVKFNGAQDEYPIDTPDVLDLVAEVVASRRLVAFHIGADSPENTHPSHLGKIASHFPDGTFIMVHMGGASHPPLANAAIEAVRTHLNIYVIASAVYEMAVVRAIQTLGPDRICFGSDTPFRLMHVQLAFHRAILQPFDERTRAQVLGGNIARLLGVPVPAGS